VVADEFAVDPQVGLSDQEAVRRRKQFGPNALTVAPGRSSLSILVDQFKSLLVVLLMLATLVAFMLGEPIEAVAILVVIVLNATIGFLTEWRADRSLTALQRQTVLTAHVRRAGKDSGLPASELVPGDIVLIAAGSRVPADGRILESMRLKVAEASLTGESLATSKVAAPVEDVDAALGDRKNMAYMGTAVTEGRGSLLVTSTGMRTEVGRIGALIDEAGSRSTPLERKLAQLSHTLLGVVSLLCAIIILVGWSRGHAFLYMLEVGISLAIAAVPEGLPAVVTMTLALGMQRMARRGALVRRLPAVETLGSTTVVCTDKTGTLTGDEMTVRAFQLGPRRIDVSGAGYVRVGTFREGEQTLVPAADLQLALALRVGALCCDATLVLADGHTTVLGDPTEGALLVAAAKAGMSKETLEKQYPRVSELPFRSETKRMVTTHRTPAGASVAYVKGGPAVVADACVGVFTPDGVQPMTAALREQLLADNQTLATQALRVLALAYKDLPPDYEDTDLADGLVFVGLVGMIDPLRDEAAGAIERCRRAGIRIVMITGDQEATAAEIGRQLGLDHDLTGRPLRTVHDRELAGLDPAGWQAVAANVGVFARVSPEHKLRIVEALQAGGEVVAMTGDGVNDAPALKQADIGVAMGIKGTEVAKEAAAMVITDDNFTTIVGAVEQGRVIYANIHRFVHYLFSCNLAEILVVFTAIMIGWPLPLAALQILWLNMLTDVFPALALALEPANADTMTRPPRDPREPLMTRRFVWLIVWQGLLLSGMVLIAFAIGMRWYGVEGPGLRHASTMAFMTVALVQVFHTFNARSQLRSAFTAQLFTNAWLWAAVATCLLLQAAAIYVPLLQRVLHTTSLTVADWGVVLGLSLAPVGIVEVIKLLARMHAAPARDRR